MSNDAKTNEPFDHNPRIAECDRELEEIEAQRLALKARGREIMARKADLMMREQLVLRILGDSPVSGNELAWVEAHPEEWAEIKEATRGKRGTRAAQRVATQRQ